MPWVNYDNDRGLYMGSGSTWCPSRKDSTPRRPIGLWRRRERRQLARLITWRYRVRLAGLLLISRRRLLTYG